MASTLKTDKFDNAILSIVMNGQFTQNAGIEKMKQMPASRLQSLFI
jgi:hypothetical protein